MENVQTFEFPESFRATMYFERESWPVIDRRWKVWRHETYHAHQRSPTGAQRQIIEYIHARTCYDFFLENKLPQLPFTIMFTPQPMLHVLHGLLGSGKSEVLKRLRSYWGNQFGETSMVFTLFL
eukprot:11216638-Karenia_brevis.AAC.1